MNPLIMAPTTLPETPPLDYIAATVAAGYDGIGLRLHRSPGLPFHPVVGNAPLVRDIKRALGDSDLAVFDIFSFYLQPETKLEAFMPALELGAELGGKYVMTMGDDPDWARLRESFARFCDLAGEFGLTATVEFAVMRPLATLKQTQQLIAEAGRDNAVICIDPLHLARAGEGPDDIRRLDPRLVPYAQITDGELSPGEPDPALLGLARMGPGVRHLPGKGSLPLREMMAALPAGLPLSVEGPPASDGVAPAQWASEVLMATRRFLAALALIVATFGLLVEHGFAQVATFEPYPVRPVRLVVGFTPGGPTDIMARVIGQWLGGSFGQQFIIENKPGASGNIATEAVAAAPPDGYTLLVVTTANAINSSFYPARSVSFNFMRDIVPVAGLGQVCYVLAVHPSVPAQTLSELIAYAKANPGKINFASGGIGTANHLSGELLKAMAGIDLVHVAYRGNAAAYTDVVAGRVQAIFSDLMSSLPYIRAGQLRALAVTTRTRSDLLPDVPPIADTVPGYETTGWYGLGAPKGTPGRIIEKLNREVNAGLSNRRMRERFAELDTTPIIVTPTEFGAFMAAEAERWGNAVRISGAKP